MFLPLLAQAAEAATPATGPAGLFAGPFIPMIFIMVIFYFLMIRPQRQKQKALDAMVAAMKSGDRVVTMGGIHGLVTSVKDSTVTLRIAEGVKTEFDKSSIARVLNKTEKAETSEKAGKDAGENDDKASQEADS